MNNEYTRWYCCEKCQEVDSYQQYPDGHNTFPRGEFIAHRDFLTTGFKTKEEAEAWLSEHTQETKD